MSDRRRLRAAERRVVEPVVEEAVREAAPLLAELERILVNRLADLPAELRQEAFRMVMNEWGRAAFTGGTVGLLAAPDLGDGA